MKNTLKAMVLVGAVAGAAGVHAEETTGMVNNHAVTFSATPAPPAVQVSKAEILAIANQAKPIRPKVPIDTKNAPALK